MNITATCDAHDEAVVVYAPERSRSGLLQGCHICEERIDLRDRVNELERESRDARSALSDAKDEVERLEYEVNRLEDEVRRLERGAP